MKNLKHVKVISLGQLLIMIIVCHTDFIPETLNTVYINVTSDATPMDNIHSNTLLNDRKNV